MEIPVSHLYQRELLTESRPEVQTEPVYSVEWIEKAGNSFAQWFAPRFNKDKKIKIFCGIGDNGATGLSVAAHLRDMGYTVKIYVVQHTYPPSLAFNRYRNTASAFKWIWVDTDMPRITENDVVIDAILGTGLNRVVSHVTQHVVQEINHSGAPIVSLDIATGLFADTHTPVGPVIEPDYTVSFTLPKQAFFFPENEKYVGELSILHIGINPERVQEPEGVHYVSAATIKSFFKKRSRFASTNQLGKALLMVGGNGSLGSAVLAAKACLRMGVGNLTVQVPSMGQTVMQMAVPEAYIQADKDKSTLTDFPDLEAFSAVGIGAGIGNQGNTSEVFEILLKHHKKPLVISHDAIEMLCQYRHLLYKLPENSTLLLEAEAFSRLIDSDLEIKCKNDFERLTALRKFAARHKVNLIFKAGTVYTILPDGNIYFNLTGNAGLATSGTQDLLSGMVTALAAQGYEMWQAAVMGVYLQGIAADLIAMKKGCSGWVASEMLDYLGAGIRKLED